MSCARSSHAPGTNRLPRLSQGCGTGIQNWSVDCPCQSTSFSYFPSQSTSFSYCLSQSTSCSYFPCQLTSFSHCPCQLTSFSPGSGAGGAHGGAEKPRKSRRSAVFNFGSLNPPPLTPHPPPPCPHPSPLTPHPSPLTPHP